MPWISQRREDRETDLPDALPGPGESEVSRYWNVKPFKADQGATLAAVRLGVLGAVALTALLCLAPALASAQALKSTHPVMSCRPG